MCLLFGVNYLQKLRKQWLCLMDPPKGTMAQSSIILVFIFTMKQSWKQIKSRE